MGAAGSVLSVIKSSPTKPSATNNNERVSILNRPTYTVSISKDSVMKLHLPEIFILRISYESLDFVDKETNLPLYIFPYQSILCWGSDGRKFQFKVTASFRFSDTDSPNDKDGYVILLTNSGRAIEDLTMKTVVQLMADMDKVAVTTMDFNALLSTLVIDGQLNENWLLTLEQFSTGRLFLANQGMQLISMIAPYAPFEKLDLACFLYEHTLNKDSFQLILNSFVDPVDRENIMHRLGLNKKAGIYSASCELGSPSA